MSRVIILRYSEIHLKGGNRGYFERLLLENTEKALDEFYVKIEKGGSRYIVSDYDEIYESKIITRLTRVFGFNSLSVAECIENDPEKILEFAKTIRLSNCSFRVTTRRADKSFKYMSAEFSAMVGEVIINNNENVSVDLRAFENEISIDIRENGKTYIFNSSVKCAGGMPTGCAGKAMCLLSGGIDSPVAMFKIARRGARIFAIHFHSYPYTSEQAKYKVIELARIVARYCGKIKMTFVSLTKLQEEIRKKCNPDYMITIMRRVMMRVSEIIAVMNKCKVIVTGESLGQVASQTMEGMNASNAIIDMPVLRPLCGNDKDEIISEAIKIGTYETSIMPYEDCCTVFLPDNPIIKPEIWRVEQEEAKLDMDAIVQDCIKNFETLTIEN